MFNNLKITCIKCEGKCNRSKVGSTYYVRDAKLEIPEGESICVFALGSILPAITGSIISSKEDEGLMDILQEWQCPDPEAKVIYRIERDG